MTGKCFCLCFVVISLVLSLVTGSLFLLFQRLHYEMALPKLLLRPRPQHWNDPRIMEFTLGTSALSIGLELPSVESFIRASATGNSLKGFAVFLNLTNACQSLDDVSKVRTQVPKIALVTLVHKHQSRCTLQELAENVQNAGYSLLIYFDTTARLNPNSTSKALLMIPVAEAYTTVDQIKLGRILSEADRTYVDIVCPDSYRPPQTDELSVMDSYLKRLYFWFLIGPLITLEWMRRTRKLFWVTDGQDYQRDGEEQASENGSNSSENEIRTMEEGENETDEPVPSNYQGSRGSNPGGEFSIQRSEEQPLLDEHTRVTRQPPQPRLNERFKYFSNLILFIAALPIAISSGGLSFFRFDDRTNSGDIGLGILAKSFLCDADSDTPISSVVVLLLTVLLWSPFQIFCFLLYSRLACTNTWVVPINFLKLIRSDWFASSISLLVLAVVVPFCTSLEYFGFFAPYNTVCTVCNMLFIIILNKHNFVTRYVFYISVCMISAYLQSSIVAVFYFILNSEGSLNNLKLTALRTVAIGLTLKLSFSSSMHIIRKLNKPAESLFEGLSEK